MYGQAGGGASPGEGVGFSSGVCFSISNNENFSRAAVLCPDQYRLPTNRQLAARHWLSRMDPPPPQLVMPGLCSRGKLDPGFIGLKVHARAYSSTTRIPIFAANILLCVNWGKRYPLCGPAALAGADADVSMEESAPASGEQQTPGKVLPPGLLRA